MIVVDNKDNPIANAENLLQTVFKIPEEKREAAWLLLAGFLSGADSQSRIDGNKDSAETEQP